MIDFSWKHSCVINAVIHLTNEDDEAVVLLRRALVQNHFLIGGGQSIGVGGAGGARLSSLPVGSPLPDTETSTETSW